jgi:hypothetical protein
MVAAATLTAMPAAAQYGNSPPPPPPPPEVPRPNLRSNAPNPTTPAAQAAPATYAEVIRAASCSITADAASGNALLATVPRSPEERTEAIAFLRASERCLHLRTRISTTPMTLRGAVAEILYETQFATPVAARTPPLGAKPLSRPTVTDEMATQLAPMYPLVDCSVPRGPDKVRDLLATEQGSDQEQAALQGLLPAFTACVPPGSQLRVDLRAMRTMFAEAIYHWSLVQRDGPTSPWAAAPPAPTAAAPVPASH